MCVLLLASVILTNCLLLYYFFVWIIKTPSIQIICYHRSNPLPPFQSSITPSVHFPRLEGVSPSQAAMSSAERHCGRSGTVRPPSFHAPLALMCAHAGGLLEAIQTPIWWDHSCSPRHVLTPQTLCPLLSSRTNNAGDMSEVARRG